MTTTIGKVHSVESCGTVDGPGIRFVVFMQGCLMRCKYCHNRDSWDLKSGTEYTPEQLLAEVLPYKRYMQVSNGGVTASGGEPLLQPEFLRDFFKLAQQEGIHTCLDTSGYARAIDKVTDELLDVTDLVILDLKHLDDEIHKDLVGVSNKRVLEFAKYLEKRGQKVWIRQVILPTYTTDARSAHLLGEFIKNMDNIEKVELLPYHTLGVHKWETLGYNYELAGIEPPTTKELERVKDIIASYIDVKISF